ncbi:type II toxin-antitoxin system VapB family antitoxin [Lipingzhangella sp. LS1_29]|uniref:Type II toxin-antitoxin system VapB family antitoxin n=1 Tax=Lipingzhangella rawalii TaxID=2055835 RepID=A0ABU2H320_9ACTN|nr:type II toxin-antitoxin system VapB family antitoxin [Lipingzhangella rawalii]MDS1269029.1 type II toxin-antitoxin system VapB family antitoxin [Lipingzhangella rawalii]
MNLNIKNREADELAAEVSRTAGESKTTAVVTALRERRTPLLAARQQEDDTTLTDDLSTIAERIRARVGGAELSSEHLYGPETGLPT